MVDRDNKNSYNKRMRCVCSFRLIDSVLWRILNDFALLFTSTTSWSDSFCCSWRFTFYKLALLALTQMQPVDALNWTQNYADCIRQFWMHWCVGFRFAAIISYPAFFAFIYAFYSCKYVEHTIKYFKRYQTWCLIICCVSPLLSKLGVTKLPKLDSR